MASREWTEIPGDELDAAQNALGYRDKDMARLLHVTERTWSRWTEQGRLPTVNVPAVARVLQRPEWLEHFDLGSPPRGSGDLSRSEVAELRRVLEERRDGRQ